MVTLQGEKNTKAPSQRGHPRIHQSTDVGYPKYCKGNRVYPVSMVYKKWYQSLVFDLHCSPGSKYPINPGLGLLQGNLSIRNSYPYMASRTQGKSSWTWNAHCSGSAAVSSLKDIWSKRSETRERAHETLGRGKTKEDQGKAKPRQDGKKTNAGNMLENQQSKTWPT